MVLAERYHQPMLPLGQVAPGKGGPPTALQVVKAPPLAVKGDHAAVPAAVLKEIGKGAFLKFIPL